MNENHKAQKEHARRESMSDGSMSQDAQKERAMKESLAHTKCEPNEGLYE